MPAAYSVDLRKRAVTAYEKGEGTQEDIANKYSISLSTLQKWLALKEETGKIVPRVPSTRGRACVIDEEALSYLAESVAKKPDALIAELIEGLKKVYQLVVSQSMVSRALEKLNLRRKKKSVYAQEQDRADVKKKGNLARRSNEAGPQ
jgi:transposase